MGETGSDVKLSDPALKFFPFKIECKNQQVFANVYKAYAQASGHEGDVPPVLIIKKNYERPLLVIDADLFISLWRDIDWQKKT